MRFPDLFPGDLPFLLAQVRVQGAIPLHLLGASLNEKPESTFFINEKVWRKLLHRKYFYFYMQQLLRVGLCCTRNIFIFYATVAAYWPLLHRKYFVFLCNKTLRLEIVSPEIFCFSVTQKE